MAPGYELLTYSVWARRFRDTVLPVGAHFWRKGLDDLWWLGKISGHTSTSHVYIIHYLNDPGPVTIALSPER